MPNQIHGHEVIAMMRDSGHTYTRTTLIVAILERFGPDARFFTCSAANLTAGQLVDFLEERGKFTGQADGFAIDESRVCQH